MNQPAFLTGVRVEGRAAQVLGAAASAEFLMLRCSQILRLALKGAGASSATSFLLSCYTEEM